MDPLLYLSGIKVKNILNNFSLKIYQNDFAVIVGKNGAGKSTLLKTIMGFIRPDCGTVSLFGVSHKNFRYKKNLYQIGYIPQVIHIDYRMPFSVRDIVAMGRYGKVGMGKKLLSNDYKIIDQAILEMGLRTIQDRPFGQLSGGERQRTQIARVLCQEPLLMLLDEPASHLDIRAQIELMDMMKNIYQKKQIPILLVTHDLYDIPKQCNRAVVIHNQQKHYDGTLEGLFTRSVLEPLYNNYTETVIQRCGNF